MRIDLKQKPFFLDDRQIEWVDTVLVNMTTEDKLNQLFLLPSMGPESAEELIDRMDSVGCKPCGFLLRGAPSEFIRRKVAKLQAHWDIPLFIAGDLDRGASNMITDGTPCGHQMMISATNDPELAYQAGLLCAKECAAVGVNWNFGPVVDIDMNPRNPITNVRTFGSDSDRVLTFARSIARGMRDGGLTPCIKHWPGDGVDERDQHFLASVNSLSKEEWDNTYGKVYRGMIDDGIETLMAAHIMLPSYDRYYQPGLPAESLLPGSLNANLYTRLLREEMGFNGLIVTDASGMGGFTERVPRSVAVPMCIAAGADIFLFCRDLEEDIAFMRQGLENGILTPERLDEAVTRILALKAHMGLNSKKENGTLVPPEDALRIFGDPQSKKLADRIADRGITLVKDTKALLPLTPDKYPDIYLIPVGDRPGYHNDRGGYAEIFARILEQKGFRVTRYKETDSEENRYIGREKISELKRRISAIIYFCNVQTNGSDSAARISWPGLRSTIPMLIHDIPTLMVSVDNPYHLLDAPGVSVLINAYTSEEHVIYKLVDKLTGESPFQGISPVDAFVGLENARL